MKATTVKERPILFSSPMVRAIIDGRKTQTRRLVKPQRTTAPYMMPLSTELVGHTRRGGPLDKRGWITCPYGVPGDRLWVKSQHWHKPASDLCPERIWHPESGILCSRDYSGVWEDRHATEAQTMDVGGFRKRPSVHMPRWACRPTLEVTEVRAQRLQDISEADCCAEMGWNQNGTYPAEFGYLQREFARLWDSIHGDGAWALNPWVWAVSFRRIT